MSYTIRVLPYDPNWPHEFERLRQLYQNVLGDLLIEAAHVGSTSVPGLAAKPILDINLGIHQKNFKTIKTKLTELGYMHRGNLDIPGREAFRNESLEGYHKHHLYVSDIQAPEFIRHKAFRDYLRLHPEAAAEYGELKMNIVNNNPEIEIMQYIELKFSFISKILKKALQSINRMDIFNREQNFQNDEAFITLLNACNLLDNIQEILNREKTLIDQEGNFTAIDLQGYNLSNIPVPTQQIFPKAVQILI